jgi:hypothetical protein
MFPQPAAKEDITSATLLNTGEAKASKIRHATTVTNITINLLFFISSPPWLFSVFILPYYLLIVKRLSKSPRRGAPRGGENKQSFFIL